MLIQSNKSLAASCAQSIMDGGSSILACSEPSKDEDTTIEGNNNAHTSISKDYQFSQQIGSQVQTFVNLLHSIADDFEASDNQLSQQFNNKSL